MSTRGTINLKIIEDGKETTAASMGIGHDAYPDYFGKKVCDMISGGVVSGNTTSATSGDKKVFRNVESVILYVLRHLEPDSFEDQEYVYDFIFKHPEGDSPLELDSSVRVKVTPEYSDDNAFEGTLGEFAEFCS
jgi:hypothetical protein